MPPLTALRLVEQPAETGDHPVETFLGLAQLLHQPKGRFPAQAGNAGEILVAYRTN